MKILIEMDTEKENIEEKVKEMRAVEKMLQDKIEQKKKDKFSEGERWLRSQPDKPF